MRVRDINSLMADGGVVGGSRTGPVVTPHTLELTPRGRVFLQLAPPETARAYLPPEYRPGRVYSDTESEKAEKSREEQNGVEAEEKRTCAAETLRSLFISVRPFVLMPFNLRTDKYGLCL
ncbi:hypothetical protein HZH68_009479 [Vespula germanica]|uniref:Uncharacterized protein n=1 Tax=Vespula germanica TaxID=30212 RepID=A0A834JYR2_VESGE|nr:hypothetical protein HZH68_009479 [Vespula germanica]